MLLTLILVGLVIVVPVLLRKPEWGVTLVAVLIYCNFPFVLAKIYHIKLANYATLALGIALIYAYMILYGDSVRGSARALLVLAAYYGGIFISFVFSSVSNLDFLPVIRNLPDTTLGFALFYLIGDLRRVQYVAGAITGTAFVLATLTVLQHFLHLEGNILGGLAQGSVEQILGHVSAWRPSGPIEDANFYAQTLLPGVAMLLGGLIYGKSYFWRAVAALAVCIVLGAILLTASRGALMAVAAMILAFLWIERKLILLAPVAVGVMVMSLLLLPSYVERVGAIFVALAHLVSGEPGGVEISIAGRLNEMHAALLTFFEHPWTGVGYGQFEGFYQAISARYDLMMRPADRSAHSLYFEIAAEQGIVGLSCLAVMLASTFTAYSRAVASFLKAGEETAAAVVASAGVGAFGYFVAALFLHDAYPRYGWVMIILGLAAERAARHQEMAAPASNAAPDGVREKKGVLSYG